MMKATLIVRALLLAVSLTGSPSALAAKDSMLGVGSDAPPLEVSAIVKGQAVELRQGLHVVEFWATWCGPCVESTPHLTELAKKFAGKVDFTGVSILEQGDALEKVKAFVTRMGAKMEYNVAYDGPAGRAEKSWFKASGQSGIPTAFVVKDGKIIWICHPMMLEPVLNDLVAGTFDPKKAAEGEQQAAQDMRADATVIETIRRASEANDFPALLSATEKVPDTDLAMQSAIMPYRFEGLAMTDPSAALVFLKKWSEGPGFEQEPKNAYEVWLIIMRRVIKLPEKDWAFLAKLLDQMNARMQPANPVAASAEATSYARSGDFPKAVEWEKKAVETAASRDDGNQDWLKRHQKKLAEYQQQAGLPVTPPIEVRRERQPKPDEPEAGPAPGNNLSPEEDVPAAQLIGQAAPSFTLEDLEGANASLADMKDSVVVLDFWATWCGPCMASLPELEALHEELAPRGLKVFAINEAESPEKIHPQKAKLKLGMPILRDTDQKVADLYLAQGIPHTVVIGRDGTVRKVFVGSGNGAAIRAAVLDCLGLTERLGISSKLPLVDDDATRAQLSQSAAMLRSSGKLVPGRQLVEQLHAVASRPVAIPAVEIAPALPPGKTEGAANLYERGRTSVLILGGCSIGAGQSDSLAFVATGFTVAASGVAVTNYHVIEESGNLAGIVAMTSDGRVVTVRSVLAADRLSDIAVIQLDGSSFTPLVLAENAPVGAPVAVISHPDNHFYMFTRGFVSRYCLQRSGDDDPYAQPVIEISADYARGSSGGPLLDLEGHVVGMVCSTKSIYVSHNQDQPVGLQMVVKDSIPSELIIALLRGQALRIVAPKEDAPAASR